MKQLEQLTVAQRAELKVWAGHVEEELKIQACAPTTSLARNPANLNASEEMRAGFNRKNRLTWPASAFPMAAANGL